MAITNEDLNRLPMVVVSKDSKIVKVVLPHEIQFGIAGRTDATAVTFAQGIAWQRRRVSASPTNVLLGDYVIEVAASSSTYDAVTNRFYVNLPSGAKFGQSIVVKDILGTAAAVQPRILPESGVLIDGQSFYDLTSNYSSVGFMWTGDAWTVLFTMGVSSTTGAPSDATYLTLSTNGSLTQERVLTVSSDLTLTDAGAGGNATLGLSTTGVSPGTFTLANVTVDNKGRITAISSGTAGAPSDASYVVIGGDGRLTNERALTVSADLTLIDSGANGNVYLGLTDTGVVSGSYNNPTVTVDRKGRITNIVPNPLQPGADREANFILIGNTGSLNNERALTPDLGIKITDFGPGNLVTVRIDPNVVATTSGAIFTGPVVFNAGLSGSLTKLSDGTSYLRNGRGVLITSVSNGPVYVGVNDDVVATLSGSDFSGIVVARGGLSGSLQQLPSGISYIVGSGSITVTTKSNGQIEIGSNGTGGGGGGGAIQIQDEGSVVTTSATVLNFIGANVQAVSAGGGVVNVYVPPPAFVSHWNTNDGSNGNQAVAESLTRTTARISTPFGGEGSPFKTGGWAGTNQAASTASTVTFTTPSTTTGFGGTSTMTVTVYDANGTSVLETYTTTTLTANGSYTSGTGNITVTLSSYAADSSRFKAKASVSVAIGSIFTTAGLTGGRYHVVITHTTDAASDGTGPYVYTQSDVFFDKNPTTPTLDGSITIGETTPWIKWLSGIQYYTTGSTFSGSITGINKLNENTIKTQDNLSVNSAEYGIASVLESPFGTGQLHFTGWTNNNNNTNTSWYNPLMTIGTTNYRYIGPTANISAYAQDPWAASATVNSSNKSILVDTYGITSTNLFEDFDDENRRQTSTYNGGSSAGNWNSAATLATGSAIVFGSKLRIPGTTTYIRSDGSSAPNADWSTYQPNVSGTNPDYTAHTVSAYYYRTFPTSAGPSYSSFTMVFAGSFAGGTALADLQSGDLEIRVRKVAGIGNTGPVTTSPLLLHGSAYNFATFDDGVTDGHCREGTSSGNTINGTFGGYSMQQGLYCEIKINNTAIAIDSITVTYI